MAVLLILGVSLLMPLPAEIEKILDFADTVVCLFFLADFFILLHLHKNRRKYFFTWGWIDLLSSIPLVDVLRWGRIARLVRLLRLLRGLRGSAGLIRHLLASKRETATLAIGMTLLIVAVFCSVAILVVEQGSGGTINSAENALWWTFCTMTTVGYGDVVPVTAMGRMVAVVTMFAGIGILGAYTALMASLLVKSSEEGYSEMQQREELIRSLRTENERLKKELDSRS